MKMDQILFTNHHWILELFRQSGIFCFLRFITIMLFIYFILIDYVYNM